MTRARLGQRGPFPPPPTEPVDAGQAMRLLVLADGAKLAVDGAISRGTAPGASEGDRAAARAVAACVGTLSGGAGPLDSLAAELRESLSAGRQARVSAAQAAALEAFAVCAARASGAADAARTRGGILEAVVGTGIPIAGALIIAL